MKLRIPLLAGMLALVVAIITIPTLLSENQSAQENQSPEKSNLIENGSSGEQDENTPAKAGDGLQKSFAEFD